MFEARPILFGRRIQMQPRSANCSLTSASQSTPFIKGNKFNKAPVPPPLRAQQQPFPPDPPFAAAGAGAGGGSAPAGRGPATIVECRRRRRIDAPAALAALEGAFESPGSLVPQGVEGSTKENVGLTQRIAA